jgi:hypothetical protein
MVELLSMINGQTISHWAMVELLSTINGQTISHWAMVELLFLPVQTAGEQ